MAKEIRSGVKLTLKDGFSQKIKNAANESKGFADKTLGAINKIDGVLSGTAAKFAAFGVTLSLGAAAKEIINLDHRMARLGLTANAGAEQIAALKRGIFEAAQSPDIKLDPTEIVSALEVIMTKTGDLKFAEDNIRNVALAIQASGEAGAPMGDVFSEFAKAGYTAREISGLMNDMVAQSDKGEFTFAEFAKNAKGVISAYSVIGNSPEDIKRANAAMQILTAGTKSSEVATTVLNSAINELTDPNKRAKLERLGITIRDKATGKLRDFNDIMVDLAAASEDMRKADYINSIFGSESIKALRAYGSEFAKRLPELMELGNTAGKIEGKSATMAKTLQSNLVNLQTAFISFADGALGGPLETITSGLNKLAEDPARVKSVFTNIALGLTAIAAVKGIAGIARLIGNLERLKGGDITLTETWSQATAMPVYVTNWGASLGMPSMKPPSGGGLLDQYGRPIVRQPNTPVPAGTPSGGGNIGSAFLDVALPAAAMVGLMYAGGKVNEMYDKNAALEMQAKRKVYEDTLARLPMEGYDPWDYIQAHPEKLSYENALAQLRDEKALQLSYQAALVQAQAADGPVFGPGFLPPALANYTPLAPQGVTLDGQVGLDVNVSVQDDRVKASAFVDRGPPWMNTGNAWEVRGYN